MFLFHCINLFKFSSFPRMMLLHLKRTHVADSGASVSLLDTPPVPKLRKLYLCCPRSQFMRSIHSHCHEEGTEELPHILVPRCMCVLCCGGGMFSLSCVTLGGHGTTCIHMLHTAAPDNFVRNELGSHQLGH